MSITSVGVVLFIQLVFFLYFPAQRVHFGLVHCTSDLKLFLLSLSIMKAVIIELSSRHRAFSSGVIDDGEFGGTQEQVR